jgi:hypothetical protein
MFPKDRPFLDCVIDGAGGNVVSKAVKLLKVCWQPNPHSIVLNP